MYVVAMETGSGTFLPEFVQRCNAKPEKTVGTGEPSFTRTEKIGASTETHPADAARGHPTEAYLSERAPATRERERR